MTDKYMSFSFKYTAQEKVYKTLQNLVKKKTRQENDILVKIIKSHYDTFSYFIIHKIKKKKKNMKRKILLFPEMRVTRKIFTRAAANLFFFN